MCSSRVSQHFLAEGPAVSYRELIPITEGGITQDQHALEFCTRARCLFDNSTGEADSSAQQRRAAVHSEIAQE